MAKIKVRKASGKDPEDIFQTQETGINDSNINGMIANIRKNPPLIKPKRISDSDDIRDIPELTLQDIENAINKNKNDSDYPYTFKIGGMIGRGGLSVVYKLLYVDESGKAPFIDMKRNYVVKVMDPIHMFLRKHERYLQATPDYTLGYLKQSSDFQFYLHQRDEALNRITHLDESGYEEDNIAKYYPELSFEMDSPVPMVTVIVMEEVVCTLSDLSISEDFGSRIHRMFKVGTEIGHALQACEYPEDEEKWFNHRDVKPVNIGIRFTGIAPDYFEYILIDCENGRFAYDQDQTMTGIMTKDFAAPELKSGKLTDEGYRLADQYSLGAVLAYILHPQDWEEYKCEMLNYSYISSVIDVCLEDDPEDRYPDFQELIDKLNEAQQMYLEKTSGHTVSEDDLKEIEERYKKLLKDKEEEQTRQSNEYKILRNNYEQQLKEKDKVITKQEKDLKTAKDEYEEKLKKKDEDLAELEEAVQSLNTKLADKENDLNAVKEQLAAADDPEEVNKLKEAKKALKKELEAVRKYQRGLISELDEKTAKNIELTKGIDSYKKVFIKKKEQEENGRIREVINETDGQSTPLIRYSYKNTRKGYTKTATTYLKDGSVSSQVQTSYDREGRILTDTRPVLNEEFKDVIEKTVYNYYDNGSYTAQIFEDGVLVRERVFTKVRQISETVYKNNQPLVYDFVYEPLSFNNEPIAVYLTAGGIRRSAPAYTYDYEYWPDGSVRTQTITAKNDDDLYNYSRKIRTYNINGLLESEITFHSDTTPYIKRIYYDSEGRIVHYDYLSGNHLNSSVLYTYDSRGRKAERLHISQYDGYAVVKSIYKYEDD